MLGLFANGLRPVIDRVYPMEQCAEAAQRLLHAEQFGKVVLAIA
jgi:NADPH:quinone reductase-like Zn-dependent oxidoreductase